MRVFTLLSEKLAAHICLIIKKKINKLTKRINVDNNLRFFLLFFPTSEHTYFLFILLCILKLINSKHFIPGENLWNRYLYNNLNSIQHKNMIKYFKTLYVPIYIIIPVLSACCVYLYFISHQIRFDSKCFLCYSLSVTAYVLKSICITFCIFQTASKHILLHVTV